MELYSKTKNDKKFGKAVGIDLGTTNSSLAIDRMDIEIVQNKEGEDLTPSVVSINNKNKILVGREALNSKKKDPEYTIIASKRLMGADFHSNEVQKYLEDDRFAYKIVHRPGTPSETVIALNNRLYAPEDIAAEILKKIKRDGEEKLGEIDRAVITVPAYFNDKAKHATKKAAELAGLEVSRLLPEPTAAAISFNLEENTEGVVLVYDFGGGTFDCSLLNMGDGQFIEMGKSGDMWLGGDDIDRLIVDEILREVEKEYSLSSAKELIKDLPVREKYLLQDALNSEAEKAKILLGEKESVVISVLGLLKDRDSDIIDIDIEITRKRFEELLTPIVEKSINICNELINSAGLDNSQIDYYLLVGGTVKTPLIQKMMKEVFGNDRVKVSKDPMSAVSYGAAILANNLNLGDEERESLKDKDRVDIVHAAAHDYYLELAKGEELLLVEKNTPLPHSVTYDLKTIDSVQNFVHFRFFNKVVDRKEQIGDVWLVYDLYDELGKKLISSGMGYKELEKWKQKIDGASDISFKLEIDENNIFTVKASFKDFPEVEITKTLSRGKRNEQIFLDLEKKIQEKVDSSNSKIGVFWKEYLRNISYAASKVNEITNFSTDEIETKHEKDIWNIVNCADALLEDRDSILPLSLLDSVYCIIGVSLNRIPSIELEKVLLKLKKIDQMCKTGQEKTAIVKRADELGEYLNNEFCHWDMIYTIQRLLNKQRKEMGSLEVSTFEKELEKINKYIDAKKYDQANKSSLQFKDTYLCSGHAKEGTASFHKDVVLS